jgi:cytochrome c oxidase assembly protein subunit 15
MTSAHNSTWLCRFAVFTAVWTLVLLGAGGLVTSHGAGLAVPDWPNTYGYNMFLFPPSQWIGGIFYEHTHRLIASFVGLLTAVLALWMWARETRGRTRWFGVALIVFTLGLMGVRHMKVYQALAGLAVPVIGYGLVRFWRQPGQLRWLGAVAYAAVILQGVLGGLRVVWLKDELGIFHGTIAQLFFVLVCAIALLTGNWVRNPGLNARRSGAGGSRLQKLFFATTLLILVQLILGATMRHQHAGLAIPDFPLAYGQVWPATDADSIARYNQNRIEVYALNPITAFQVHLQMVHRLVAVVILIAVIACGWIALRRFTARSAVGRLGAVWMGLIAAQVALGAFTVLSNKAADIATAHVLVGALSLATGAMLCIVYGRSPKSAPGAVFSDVAEHGRASKLAPNPAT